MTADFTGGFKNGEANIEELNQPIHEKYFTVLQHEANAKEFQDLQKRRMVILHSLYQIKQRQSSKVSLPFKDYVAQFMEDEGGDGADDNRAATTEVGFSFIIVLLNEMRTLNNGSVLENALTQFVQILKRQGAGSLFEGTIESFKLEASLNEAREFLVAVMREKTASKSIRALAARTLLVLAYARSSVEDFFQLLLLLQELLEQGQVIDLTEELKLLQKESSASDQGEVRTLSGGEVRFSPPAELSYLQPMSLSSNKGYAVDGAFLYMVNSERGLIKAQYKGSNCPGSIVRINPEAKGQSLMLFKNQLYVRNSEDKPLPFKIYDADTLERVEIEDEEKRYEPAEGETRSLQWTELNEETGRQLGETPLFTDGTFLYVLARRQKTKAEKEKVSAVTDENENKPKLVLEIYDPSEKFKFVREVTLYKNAHKTTFCKHENGSEIFEKTCWATNGQHLLCFFKGKGMLFSLETGVREVKERIHDSEESDPYVSGANLWTHDRQKNTFSYVYEESSTLRVRQCSFSRFKPPRDGGSTLCTLETLEKKVQGANQATSVPNLSSLNVFERLIQNVTNRDLAANEKQRQSNALDEKELTATSSTLILKYINDKYPEFEQHYQNVSQSESKEYREVIETFRYPNVTSLTSNFFVLIRQHLT
jgi:hypothetical protein